jgi:hypothetical protein
MVQIVYYSVFFKIVGDHAGERRVKCSPSCIHFLFSVLTFSCVYFLLCLLSPVFTFSCVYFLLCSLSPVFTFSCVYFLLCSLSPVFTFSVLVALDVGQFAPERRCWNCRKIQLLLWKEPLCEVTDYCEILWISSVYRRKWWPHRQLITRIVVLFNADYTAAKLSLK